MAGQLIANTKYFILAIFTTKSTEKAPPYVRTAMGTDLLNLLTEILKFPLLRIQDYIALLGKNRFLHIWILKLP